MKGTLIIFDSAKELVEAARLLQSLEVEQVDAFTPYHLRELDGLLPTRPNRVSKAVFSAAAMGAVGAYTLLYVTAVIMYPFDVAGTPHHSWPAFLPVTFETAVLIGSLTAFFSVFFFCGLPQYHHPHFDLPEFDRASKDRFLLWVPDKAPHSLPPFEGGDVREV